MKKSEKRRIGEARQAKYAEQNRQSGLMAQNKDHEARAKRQKDLMREKARNEKKRIADGLSASTDAAVKASLAMSKVGRKARESANSINKIVIAMAEDDAKSA